MLWASLAISIQTLLLIPVTKEGKDDPRQCREWGEAEMEKLLLSFSLTATSVSIHVWLQLSLHDKSHRPIPVCDNCHSSSGFLNLMLAPKMLVLFFFCSFYLFWKERSSTLHTSSPSWQEEDAYLENGVCFVSPRYWIVIGLILTWHLILYFPASLAASPSHVT